MKIQQKFIITCLTTLLAIYVPVAGFCNTQQASPWKEEFARLCSHTETVSALPDQQVRDLIRDSDALLEKLQSLNDPQVRVYLFRLKKCRQFFEFTLQLRETS